MIDERDRETAKDLAVRAYSTGALTEERMESALSAIMSASDPRDLARLSEALRPLAAASSSSSPEVQVLRVSAAGMRKSGDWLASDRVRVESDRSSIRLDFSALADRPGLSVVLDLDIDGCVLKALFPRGTEIVDEIENTASVIRCRSRGENFLGLKVFATGRAKGSVVTLKANRRVR